MPDSQSASARLDDPHEFAAQFAAAYSRLTIIAAGITGDRTQAEDIVQEAALIAVAKRHQLTPGASVAAWLASIVRNCALNYRRKVRRRRTYAADPSNFRELPETSVPASDAEVSHGIPGSEAFDDQVLAALDELTEEARCCLLLRIVGDLAYCEIAELLEMPEGTAMSHVHRAKAALRRRLASRAAGRPSPRPAT